MATIQQALYYELANSGGVSAIVSTRVYPGGDVPQLTTRPFLTYQQISRNQHRHINGGPNLTEARFQITCVDDTQAEAWTLANAVLTELNRFRGAMGESGSTVTVRGCFLESDSDVSVTPSDGGQRGPHQVPMDFVIFYVEA